MAKILGLKKSNCKNCYKCIRHCPVKSIRFENNQAHIIQDECVLCGMCFAICPQNAKEIRDDTYLVKKAIKEGKRVIATLAPSFVANYANTNLTSIRKTMQKLGFFDVYETAEGAHVVKKEYERLVKEKNSDVIISTCCHTVNLTIQKYYPELIKYMAHVKSPMQVSGDLIKDRYPDAFVVFIGPCISKKDEIETCKSNIDVVLTFEELDNYLKEENVSILSLEEDKKEESRSRLFPISGGILNSMNKSADDGFSYLAVDGMENVIKALDNIKNHHLKNVFIEMSACYGSCINGPAFNKEHKSPISDYIKIKEYAGKADFLTKSIGNEEKLFNQIDMHKVLPTEEQINSILVDMGKTSIEKELNCGSCGYETCRGKAIAIYQGKALKEMCLPYLQEKAQSFSNNIVTISPNGLMVIDEKLKIELANNAMCNLLDVNLITDLVGKSIADFIEPSRFILMLDDKRQIRSQNLYLEKQNKYVLLNAFYDEQYHIIIIMMNDVTKETLEKKKNDEFITKTIEITDNVIKKQMTTVQEIASLLGESTAESKVALIKLKESLKNDK